MSLEVRLQLSPDGFVPGLGSTPCPTSGFVPMEKESFLVAVEGVQVLSFLTGVLEMAVASEDGLAGILELKCIWWLGHRRMPAPNSAPSGEVSHSIWHCW